VTFPIDGAMLKRVADPNNPSQRSENSAPSREISMDLADEIQRATNDFERDNYIEVTAEQLERCAETGESP